MVAGFCAREHIPHAILHPAAPISGSLQAAARAERYRLLEQWREAHALDHVVTAHHADDQLETMIMRLNRSSGVGGLAGVRARNGRSEEHTSELQSLMRISYAVFCLK